VLHYLICFYTIRAHLMLRGGAVCPRYQVQFNKLNTNCSVLKCYC